MSQMRSTDHQTIVPPHSIEAEQAVLGALVNEKEQLYVLVDRHNLKPDHFYTSAHREIFAAMLDQESKVGTFDLVSLICLFQDRKDLGINSDYISDIATKAPLTQNLGYYVEIIKQKFFLRRIMLTCYEVIDKVRRSTDDSQQHIELLEKEILEISKDQDHKGGLKNAREVLLPTLEAIERRIGLGGGLTGIPSGFTDLDAYTGGWQRSDLVILAARPGMGKTALALNWLLNAVKAKNDAVAAIFSLEMSKEQLMERLLSSIARVDSVRLRKGDLTEADQDRIVHGSQILGSYGPRLVIDDTPGVSLSQLRSRCRRYQKEHGLDLIIIDYLQLMTASVMAQKQGREREIGEISMGLKALAKELTVPVIALAQLNRGPDARPDKRPKISDLRESGSMEQDADMILFVYRDEYYHPNSEHAGKAEVILAKNRHGETGGLYLAWMPHFVSFHNLMKN